MEKSQIARRTVDVQKSDRQFPGIVQLWEGKQAHMIYQIKTTEWWQRTTKDSIRVSGCISYSQQKFPENKSRLSGSVCDLILLNTNNSFSRKLIWRFSTPKWSTEVVILSILMTFEISLTMNWIAYYCMILSGHVFSVCVMLRH